MQKDQENHFDESIRRKLQEEEYMAPPFSLSMQQSAGSGFSWLRGFLFGDCILLLSCLWLSLNFSGIQNATSAANADHSMEAIQIAENEVASEPVSEPAVSTTAGKVKVTAVQSAELLNNSAAEDQVHSANEQNDFGKTSSKDDKEDSDVFSAKRASSVQDFSPELSVQRNSASPEEELTASNVPSAIISQPEVNPSADIEFMDPLTFHSDINNDYTLKTRDFSHTPDLFRKPFALDVMLIGEKTLGYNRVYPEVSQLHLDLTPRDNGFGAGVLFSYRIVKRISILSGIETVFRKYNLNYTYTRSSMVQQPDGSYKEMEEILTNSRSVSETEVRLPFLATYTFDAGKWQFEPAAGFTIKFKNLNVSANGSDQIPAALLSTIEVSNEHLVTAGWMFSCSAGYQLLDNSLVFIAPFYQAESFGKNSRQYYSGRAVSGAGLKAGMRILFYQPR